VTTTAIKVNDVRKDLWYTSITEANEGRRGVSQKLCNSSYSLVSKGLLSAANQYMNPPTPLLAEDGEGNVKNQNLCNFSTGAFYF